jgi:hypothetical protein
MHPTGRLRRKQGVVPPSPRSPLMRTTRTAIA